MSVRDVPLILLAIINYCSACEVLFYCDLHFLINLIITKFFIRKKEGKDRLRKPVKYITFLKDGFYYSHACKMLSWISSFFIPSPPPPPTHTHTKRKVRKRKWLWCYLLYFPIKWFGFHDFQPFSSHGTHKLITKILRHTKIDIFFADLTKKIGIIFIHSQQTAIVLTAVVFLFDSLREKRSVPLTKQSGIACFKNSCSTPVENRRSQLYVETEHDRGPLPWPVVSQPFWPWLLVAGLQLKAPSASSSSSQRQGWGNYHFNLQNLEWLPLSINKYSYVR